MLNAVFGMKVFLFLLAALASTSRLLAQTGAAPPMAYTRTTTILEAMIAAGPVMIYGWWGEEFSAGLSALTFGFGCAGGMAGYAWN